jgi:hypothetical protein
MTRSRETRADEAGEDPHVARLRRLFETHPIWLAAARHVSPEAHSSVRFSHLPRREWTLRAEGERTVLEPGTAPDPDFAFRFTPASVERLEATRGRIADFAIALFDLIEDPDPDVRVDFRVVAPFGRLVRRGYLTLLISAGPGVLAYGVSRGVASVGALRRLVERHRREGRR